MTAESALHPYEIPIFATYTLKFRNPSVYTEISIQCRRDKGIIETLSHAIEKAKKIYPDKKFEFVRLNESYQTVTFFL